MVKPYDGPERRLKKQHVVPVNRVRGVLEALPDTVWLHVDHAEESEDGEGPDEDESSGGVRQPSCYVEIRNSRRSPRYPVLGPFAKWIVAADLLTKDLKPETGLHEAIPPTGHMGTNKAALKRVFGMRPGDRKVTVAARYMAHDVKSPNRAERASAQVLNKIVDTLNARFGAQRLEEISLSQLLAVDVPINPAVDSIGTLPLAWFQSWLRWGVGSSLTWVSDGSWPTETGLGHVTKAWKTALSNALRPADFANADPAAHRRILNVYSDGDLHELRNFAACIPSTLSGLDREGGVPQAAYISLRDDATRATVLQRLYDTFGIDSARLQSLHRGERTLDLDSDLEPVRKALTVNDIVVVFDGWEVAPGEFSALREFLTNTHWGEFLRVLAQPHMETLRASLGAVRPTYCLLVLSTAQADRVGAWANSYALTKVWSPGASAVEVKQARQASLDEGRRLCQAALHRGNKADASKSGGERLLLNAEERLAVRLIAASVNGMRPTTLARCVYEFFELFKARPDAKKLEPGEQPAARPMPTLWTSVQVKQLLDRCKGLLVETSDEQVENLNQQQRDLELSRNPLSVSYEESSEGHDVGVRPTVLTFATKALRAEFVEAWIQAEDAAAQARDAAKKRSRAAIVPLEDEAAKDVEATWARVSLVLAEESLRQSSTQLRHLNAEAPSTPYSLRRAVQAVYHGLASLPAHSSNVKKGHVTGGGLYGPALPTDARRRYKYLYSMIFKRVADGGEARLSRSFGRADLRLDILQLFGNPTLAHLMLTGRRFDDEAGALPQFPFEAPLPEEPTRAQRRMALVAEGWRNDREVWSDLVEAIGRTGYDLGGPSGNAAVQWALLRLPHERAPARTNSVAPLKHDRHHRLYTSALKLRVDWEQASGSSEQLDAAEQLCWDQLARLGVHADLIETELFQGVRTVLEKSFIDASSDIRSLALQNFQAVQDAIELRTPNASARLEVADMLFRLGEILATKVDTVPAENAPGKPAAKSAQRPSKTSAAGGGARRSEEHEEAILGFSNSFAVFYVADRLRAGASMLGDSGLKWPRASGRSMRLYVRVLLKLARLLSLTDIGRDGVRTRMAVVLLEQAQGRIGVYTRHNYEFKRERDSMLLLEASRLRTWARITIEKAAFAYLKLKKTPGTSLEDLAQARLQLGRTLDSASRLLKGTWELNDKAERNLISLGFQTAHVRRLMLERIKTALASAQVALTRHHLDLQGGVTLATALALEVNGWIAQARTSLGALRAATDERVYWKNIIARQVLRIEEVERRALKPAG